MAGVEKPAGLRVTLLADWASGRNRFGYLGGGFGLTLTPRDFLYAGYEEFETRASSLLAELHGQLRLIESSAAAQAGRCAPAAPAAEAYHGRGSLDTLFRTGEVL